MKLREQVGQFIGKEPPEEFINIAYDPFVKSFCTYAGTVTLDDDNNFYFEGPEADKLRESVEYYLETGEYFKFPPKSLPVNYYIKTSDGSATAEKWITPDDEEYPRAINKALPLYYNFLPDGYEIVHSMEDVKRLDREYAEKKKREEEQGKAQAVGS